MQVIWENDSNEQKLLEEKRETMNKLIGLNNVSIKENITLLISEWCAEHIKILHKEYPHTEWLAVCKVEPQGNWVFLMTDMVFPWQKGVGWEVETTKEWMEWLNKELLARNEIGTERNCILHSHHSMGCFWSGTDDNARLSLNDWRKLAWAVVTAYKWEEISYKGCLNFYKPYNIEIDVEVKNAEDTTIVDRYNDYLVKLKECENKIYDRLVVENEDYIDSITSKPSYSNLIDYLWIDITEELNENYEWIKDKIWNPELLDYLNSLQIKANEMAVEELNNDSKYPDMIVEYWGFCYWSDKLLKQLEENRKQETTLWSVYSPWLLTSTTYPTNRDFEDYDEYYYFSAPECTEYYVRQTFWIDNSIPMKTGRDNERMAWSRMQWRYLYVEDWAEEFWG